jgi:hypothetical protein
MSVHILCKQVSTIVSKIAEIKINNYSQNQNIQRFQELSNAEFNLRAQIYRLSGIPAYQLCEYCEPYVSEK